MRQFASMYEESSIFVRRERRCESASNNKLAAGVPLELQRRSESNRGGEANCVREFNHGRE